MGTSVPTPGLGFNKDDIPGFDGSKLSDPKRIGTVTHRLHPHADSLAARHLSPAMNQTFNLRSIEPSTYEFSLWLLTLVGSDFGGCVWSLKGTLGIASKCNFNGEKNGEPILQTNHHSFQVVCCELDSRLLWFIMIHHADTGPLRLRHAIALGSFRLRIRFGRRQVSTTTLARKDVKTAGQLPGKRHRFGNVRHVPRFIVSNNGDYISVTYTTIYIYIYTHIHIYIYIYIYIYTYRLKAGGSPELRGTLSLDAILERDVRVYRWVGGV